MGFDRRLVIGLGGVIALVLLFMLVIQPLFFGASDDDLTVPLPPPAGEPPGTLPDDPDAAPDDPLGPVLPRDPFQQLVVVGAAPGVGVPDGAPPPIGEPGTPGDGTTPGSDAQVGATTVTLIDVFTDDDGSEKVIVEVNGTMYTAGEGEQFADRFRVLDITDRCATFLFGDSRFVLCAGEAIRK